MKSITRKSLIYKTGVEYGDYTLNHVFGCSHGCKYPCYAYQMMKRFGKIHSYDEWIEPSLVENTMDIFATELPKYKDRIKMLHLCFSTDPFMMGCEKVSEMSLDIIKKANQFDIPCSILTKGKLPQELSSLNRNNEYGITLITLNEEFRKEMEPGAADIESRVTSLEYLHNHGCKTWVSIEPYPTPNFIKQDLNLILERISFVDKIIFGRMHYNKQVSEYKNYKEFYRKCVDEVITFCEQRNITYHIKKGTI